MSHDDIQAMLHNLPERLHHVGWWIERKSLLNLKPEGKAGHCGKRPPPHVGYGDEKCAAPPLLQQKNSGSFDLPVFQPKEIDFSVKSHIIDLPIEIDPSILGKS